MIEKMNKHTKRQQYQASLLSLVLLFSLAGCGSGDNKPTVVEPTDTTAPVVSLTGESAVTIAHGATYAESGASATDDTDASVTVTTTGTVDTATVGSYTLTYSATDTAGNSASVTRTVNVTDQAAPVLALNGDSALSIFQGTAYVETDATATDAVDGALTASASGTVDNTTLGDYTITYTATDAAGNAGTITRTVTVVPMTLNGTAAAGAAIIGTVTVKGSLGNQKSEVIEADGSYEVDVTGLTPPYRLRAQGTVGGKTYQLHSYAESASVDGTVNITPFTDLIIANAAQQVAASFFDSASETTIEPAVLVAQENALQEKLQAVLTALGVDAAIDLLSTSFSADHSGLDAALDVIQIESTEDNIVTIRNLIDGSEIDDDITDTDDNSESLTVTSSENLQTTVSDTVAIANLFDAFSELFAQGLPSADDVSDLFSSDFLEEDGSRGEFLTDITTDPEMVGISFASVSISELDINTKMAVVHFNAVFDGVVDAETNRWLVAKDETLGWQLRGDQLIVDLDEINYHCNDFNGADDNPGGCGINVSISDENFDNNGTNGEPISSAMVQIIDSADGSTVKATIYLGNPDYSPNELHVYNPAQQSYSGDYMGFGMTPGTIDPEVFVVGDIVQYQLFTASLGVSDIGVPMIVGDPVATYIRNIEFVPETVGRYPVAAAETIVAIDNIGSRDAGDDLIIEWTLAEGTIIDEILVVVRAADGDRLDYWDDLLTSDATSATIDGSVLDGEFFASDDIDLSQGYLFLIRIYAQDEITGNIHSTDYRTIVPADDSGQGSGGETPTYSCGYESEWDEVEDRPVVFDSFASFESVTSDCGGVMAVTAADFAGKTYLDDGEMQSFNDDGLATMASPSTGLFNDGAGELIDFEWYIEVVNGNSYLVIYTNTEIDGDLPPDFELRDTMALTERFGEVGASGASYAIKIYSEQSDYDASDMVRANGADGEIWGTVFTIE